MNRVVSALVMAIALPAVAALGMAAIIGFVIVMNMASTTLGIMTIPAAILGFLSICGAVIGYFGEDHGW